MFLAIWAGDSLAAAMRRGTYRLGSGVLKFAVAAVMLAAAALMLARPGFAIDIVDIAKAPQQQDLARYLAGLQTDKRTVQIERPDARTALRTQMSLPARRAAHCS